jgi:hypothetical protein
LKKLKNKKKRRYFCSDNSIHSKINPNEDPLESFAENKTSVNLENIFKEPITEKDKLAQQQLAVVILKNRLGGSMRFNFNYNLEAGIFEEGKSI